MIANNAHLKVLWTDIDGSGTSTLLDALLLRGRKGAKLPG